MINLPPPQSIKGMLGNLRGLPEVSMSNCYVCCHLTVSHYFYRLFYYKYNDYKYHKQYKVRIYDEIALCAECLSHPIRLLTRDDAIWRFVGQILAENQGVTCLHNSEMNQI